MRDYYLPRWQMRMNATLAELVACKNVDRDAIERKRLRRMYRRTHISTCADWLFMGGAA
jgi:hypothetical protein